MPTRLPEMVVNYAVDDNAQRQNHQRQPDKVRPGAYPVAPSIDSLVDPMPVATAGVAPHDVVKFERNVGRATKIPDAETCASQYKEL